MINGRHENPRMNNFCFSVCCYSLLIRLRVSSVIESSVQNFNSLRMYGYFWTCTYRSFFFPTTRVIKFHFHVLAFFYCSFYIFYDYIFYCLKVCTFTLLVVCTRERLKCKLMFEDGHWSCYLNYYVF